MGAPAMRLPRFRLRTLMVAVAVVGAGVGTDRLHRLRELYLIKAGNCSLTSLLYYSALPACELLESRARYQEQRAEEVQANGDRIHSESHANLAAQFRAKAESIRLRAEYHAQL